MRSRSLIGVSLVLCAGCHLPNLNAQSVQTSGTGQNCRSVLLAGQVRAGESFAAPIGGGLKFTLEPIRSGWILRVIPAGGLQGGEADYAEVATPPYRSVTPLSLSTDFAFRAQDAIGWNPREFRFATDRGSFHQLLQLYRETGAVNPAQVTSVPGTRLGELLSGTGVGRLRILDARLTPGMADQWTAAATVASHFSSTAHTLEKPADGRSSPLGELHWIRFQVDLRTPTKPSREAAVACSL